MTSIAGTVLHLQFGLVDRPSVRRSGCPDIQIQLPALIGGLATAGGPVIGGVIMIVLSEVTNIVSGKLDLPGVDVLAYGLVLLVIVFKAPQGVLGLITSPRPQRKARGPMATKGAR